MRIFTIPLMLIALAIGGCAKQPIATLNTSVTLNTMQGIVAAYGTALSVERSYKSLPLCKTGTHATITNPCAQRSIIVRLQAADLRANLAVNAANNFIKTYPTVDPGNVISAAGSAVKSLQDILNGVN